MEKLTDKPPMSWTDKLCAVILVGAFLAPNLIACALDAAAHKAAETDKPMTVAVTVSPIDCTPFVEAIEARGEELFWRTVPLDPECREALLDACAEYEVAGCDILGLIEIESGFDPDAVSGEGCVGLMQTNAKYASVFEENTGYSIYTPEGNIRCGVWYLASLIEKYDGNQLAALTAYNKGSYTGTVNQYAKNVMQASEKWGVG